MKKLISIFAEHPWSVILVILAITFAAGSQLNKLNFSISAESMMVEGDPNKALYEQSLETFGSDSVTIIFLQDDNLFQTDKLGTIKSTLATIEALPFVSHTDSLFSINRIESYDGDITSAPYLEEIPETVEQAQEIIEAALKNPFISKNLLSPSATAMAINVYLKKDSSISGIDKIISSGIEEVISPLAEQLQSAFQIGSPYVRGAISEKIYEDQIVVLPLSLMVLLITLGLTLRRVNAVVIPLLTASLSVVWTLGLMALLGIPINVMTSIVPVLLIIIGSTEDIHLLSEYHSAIAKGKERMPAVHYMGNKMGTAVVLTFTTTYLGFLSISLNDISLLKEFGLVASTGLLLNFLITVALVPVVLRFFGIRSDKRGSTRKDNIFQRFAVWIHLVVRKFKRSTIALLIVLSIIFAAGAFALKVNNTPLDYFDPESEVIQRINSLQDELAGMQNFSIVLDSGIESTFLKVRYLEEIQKLQTYLVQSGIADKTLSFADYLSLINTIMEEDDSGDMYLPDADEIVNEYMLFISHDSVKSYVSPDYSEAKIFVRHHLNSSYELKQAMDRIQTFIDENVDPNLDIQITGESILTNRAADYMASAQAKSLTMMVAVILIIISLLFVTPRAGLVAVVPNVFPIIILFGVMGFAGIPLDTGTAMTAAIALGICVDDTMHFMVRYHHATSKHKEESKVLENTVRDEAVPIIATSVALALGFSSLAFSDFPPVAYFGLLSAMVMILALLATFVITPLMLSTVHLITVWDVLSLRLKAQVVNNCALFQNMRSWQIKKLILTSGIEKFQANDVIVKQGDDTSDEMFVILEGSASAWLTDNEGNRHKLRTLHMGDVFGEISLISNIPRTADVIADEPIQALAIGWTGVQRIAKFYPRISSKLFLNLSSIVGDRLTHTAPAKEQIRDEVTGTFNKAYFKELAVLEFHRAERHSDPLSLLTIDIGKVTDAEGTHELNHQLLKELADKILMQARNVDICTRWNNHQFLMLLPRTSQENAQELVGRIASAIASKPLTGNRTVNLTIGIAQFHPGDKLDNLLKRAEISIDTVSA